MIGVLRVNQMLVRIANSEGPEQTASTDSTKQAILDYKSRVFSDPSSASLLECEQ